MKNTFTNFFNKPAVAIPTVGAIIVLAGALSWGSVGIAPTVDKSLIATSAATSTVATADGVNLAFTKAGRVEAVLVKEGDKVKAGQTLARLAAPDAVGAISQAKGALELARAQLAALDVQYQNTEKQQDQIVENAYQTLLSSGLEATPDKQNPNAPIVTGTYICSKEGSYIIDPYSSNQPDSGFSFEYKGLEGGNAAVAYDSSVPLGVCGLAVKFPRGNFDANTTWTISIPNIKSSTYVTNKNTYDLARANREKALSDLATSLGKNTQGASVAQEAVRGPPAGRSFGF